MGRQAAQQVAQTLGFIEDDGLQALVQQVGARLAADSERPSLPWEFHVVDDPTPNAFALPGGFIYVTRGMVTLMTSEAQLASVLGHEIGHVTARHSVAQISQQQLAQIGLGLGSIFSPAVQQLSSALGAGLQLLFLRHGRDDERQADELGFRYIRDARLRRAGVRQSVRVARTNDRGRGREPGAGVALDAPGACRARGNGRCTRCGGGSAAERHRRARDIPARARPAHVRREPAEWLLRGPGVLSPGHAVSASVSGRLADPEHAAGSRRGRPAGCGRVPADAVACRQRGGRRCSSSPDSRGCRWATPDVCR